MLQKGKISIDEIQTFFPELSNEEIEEVKDKVMRYHKQFNIKVPFSLKEALVKAHGTIKYNPCALFV